MSCDRKIGPFDCCSVVQGDCLELMKQLPDGCVDAVITDPPYHAVYADLFEGIAECSARAVKSGGFIYAYCGAHNMPELIARMGKYLTWFWLFNLRLNGGNPRVWNKKLMIAGKPVMVWTNGIPRAETLKWGFNECISEKEAKEFHEWGQSIGFVLDAVNDRTELGELVLDPCVGGGTTLIAARRLGRHFVGFEKDPNTARIARERIARVEAQPNLFEKKAIQETLTLDVE